MRRSVVVGLTLALAAVIAVAQLDLFPSMLNKSVVAHPWLLQRGLVDYRDLPEQKSPLLPMFLSWVLPLFGHDAALAARSVHALFITLIVLIAMLWVYRHAGVWAWGATGLFLLTWSNYFGLWATAYYDVALAVIYLLFFVLIATQLEQPGAWVWAAMGLVGGLAILTKQHGVLLTLPAAALLIWHRASHRITTGRLFHLGVVYVVALLLPIAAYVVYHYRQAGTLGDLAYCIVTINFVSRYGSEAALAPELTHVRSTLPALMMLVPLLGSVLRPAAIPGRADAPGRGARILLLGMLALGLVLLYPRYSTRHWPPAFCFLAMASGVALADLVRAWRRWRADALLWMGAVVILMWLAIAAIVYVPSLQDPASGEWAEYSNLVELAADLRQRIPAEGNVALLPQDESNANLIYLLGRTPPPYWLFHYSWWMNPTTIGRWLEVMEADKPPAILFFPEGLDLTSSAPAILEYVQAHYQVVDTVPWGDSRHVQIMKRLPTAQHITSECCRSLTTQ